MEKNDLSYLSVEDLRQKIKMARITIWMFIISQVMLLFSAIYLTIKKGQFSPFMIIPIAFLPMIILQVNSIKKFRAEIQSREGA